MRHVCRTRSEVPRKLSCDDVLRESHHFVHVVEAPIVDTRDRRQEAELDANIYHRAFIAD